MDPVAAVGGLVLLVVLAFVAWQYLPGLKDIVGGVGNIIGDAVVGPIGDAVATITEPIADALEPVTDAIAAAIPAGARGWLPTSAKDVAALPGKALADPVGAAKAAVLVQPQVVAATQVAKAVMPILPAGMRFDPSRPEYIVDAAGNTLAQVVGGKGIASITTIEGTGFRSRVYTVLEPAGGALKITDAGRQILISLPGGKWASKAFKPLTGPAGDAARTALRGLSEAQKIINVGGIVQKVDPRKWF